MWKIDDLTENYDRHFTIVRANTTELLDEVYRLRYQVFCVENSIFDANDNPSGREQDEHDAISEHILLFHRSSGTAVGTARVVMPYLGITCRPLPMQCALATQGRQILEQLPIRQTGEISRFAISKAFRRWWGEAGCPAGSAASRHSPCSEQHLMRHITFGLMGDIVQICIEHGIIYLAAFMEPSLVRILLKLGLEFEPIGERIEYHGVRQPCVARLADLIERSRDRLTPLWQFVSLRDAFSSLAPTPFPRPRQLNAVTP